MGYARNDHLVSLIILQMCHNRGNIRIAAIKFPRRMNVGVPYYLDGVIIYYRYHWPRYANVLCFSAIRLQVVVFRL